MKPGQRAMKVADAMMALLNDDVNDHSEVEDEEIESETEDDEDDLPISALIKRDSIIKDDVMKSESEEDDDDDDLPLNVLAKRSAENCGKKSLKDKIGLADEPKRILSDKTNSLSNNKSLHSSNNKSLSIKESKYNVAKSEYVLKNLFSFLNNNTNDKENLTQKGDYVGETSDEEDVIKRKTFVLHDFVDMTISPSIKLLKMNYQREKVTISSPVFALNTSTNKRKRI